MTAVRIHVLVAISSLEIGGAEQQVVEVCRLLHGDEFEFDVAVFNGGGPLEGRLRETGAGVHVLYGRDSPAPRSKSARAFRAAATTLRLRRLLAKLRPDVLHSYLTETSALLAAARWPRRLPPFVFSKRSLVQWIARRSIYFPVARWTNRQANLILANSEAVRREALEKEGAPGERIRVVYNGVDTELVHPGVRPLTLAAELGIPADATVIGMVANQHLYKGHREVLEACAQLPESPDWRLVLVGREGNASEAVGKEISKRRLSGRVILAGPRTDIPRVLNLFDIFVSASHEEGFSNSVLEAMAAGRAIVATSVGGTVEQIESEVSGLLVPPRDASAMRAALERLLTDRELRRRFGRLARERAVASFSLERLRASMADVYRTQARAGRSVPA